MDPRSALFENEEADSDSEPFDMAQLSLILEFLGELREEDKQFLEDSSQREHLKIVESSLPRLNFNEEFPKMPSILAEILQ